MGQSIGLALRTLAAGRDCARIAPDRLAATLQEICRSQRLTVILVTHDLRLAERVADYLLYLEGGQILEEGKTEDLLIRPKTAELVRFLAEPEE